MKTVINVKADKEVKEQAVAAANDIGLPLSTVVNALLRKFIADKSITFDVSWKPSKQFSKTLKRALKDVEAGRNLSPLFSNMEKMDRYLAGLK